jgi:hypothetical protein
VSKRLIQHAPTAVVAASLIGVAFGYGGYGLTTRSIVAVVAWWAIILGLGLGLLPFRRPPRDAYLSGGLLAGLAILAGLSVLWSASPEKSFVEFDRITLYLGFFVLAVLAGTRANATRWVDGLAIGIAVVGLLALTTRLLPGLVPGGDEVTSIPNAQARLAFPLGYSNALGILLAVGYPLLLRSSVAARTALARGLAVGVIPALSAAIFLTSSRGAIGCALLGVAVFLALARPRGEAAWASVCAAGGSALLVAALKSRVDLVSTPFDNPAVTVAQGRAVAAVALLVCFGAGLAYLGGIAAARARGLSLRTPGIGRQGRLAIGVIAAVALVAVVIAVDPGARIESFKQTEPRGRQPSTGQLLSLGGGGRYQFWSAAVDQFRANPVLGGGAGTYEFWWAANPRFPYSVRDAHSLWLEILGELGLVGLILAVGAFGYGILVALRRVRGEGPDRILVAALGATLFAWAFAAAIDWMWEMTVVSAVAVICLGLITGPATAHRPQLAPSSRGSRSFSVGVAVIAAAWLVICAQASPLLSEMRIADSQVAAARGEFDAALTAARGARTLQPWAGGPYRQLALIEEERARFTVARGYIQEAIAREPGNAELWRDAARIERGSGNLVGAGQRFERARRLDPSLSAARRRSAR